MRVGAVVLHYRRWPDVRRCLDALEAQSRPADEVLVVDNASGDGSAAQLAAAYPDLRLVESPDNRGYGPGMNLGIASLREPVDAVLLLTHECELAPDALAILLDRLESEPDVGAVGPLVALNSDPDRVYSAGGWLDPVSWRPRHHQKPTAAAEWAGADPRTVAWLDGSVLLLRRAALDGQPGPFDERYFMYYEETDLLVRLGESGWRVECVPQARAWQEPGPKPTYLWTRNRLWFLARRAPRRALAREVLRLLRRGLRPSADRRDPALRAELAAVVDFARRRSGRPPERHRPSGSAVTSAGDEALDEAGELGGHRDG